MRSAILRVLADRYVARTAPMTLPEGEAGFTLQALFGEYVTTLPEESFALVADSISPPFLFSIRAPLCGIAVIYP